MRMKTICGVLLVAGATFTACQEQGYTIKGTLTGDAEGKTVYLCRGMNIFALEGIDSTVVTNGQFEFTGTLAEPELLTVKIFPDSTRSMQGEHGIAMRPIIPLIVENGAYEINACLDSIPLDFMTYGGYYDYTKVGVKGPQMQTAYMDYQMNLNKARSEKNEQSSQFYRRSRTDEGCTADDCIAFVKQQDSLQNIIVGKAADAIRQNAGSVVGLYMLSERMSAFDAATLGELTQLFPENVKNTVLGREVLAKADTVKACAIGSPYIDLALQDVEGNPVKLSECIEPGKYTLVEFWASWCGPCRGEIPHLKKVYELYHADGFNIVSISMDAKKADWTKAIESEGMEWTQLSDLKAFEGPIHRLYNFDGIPYCVLVNPEGVIVHHNARGPELDNILIANYGNKFPADYRLYK